MHVLFLCMYQLCIAQCRHVGTQAMWDRPDNRPAVRSRRGLMRYGKGAGRHVKNAFLDIRVGSFCSSSAGPLSGLLNVFLFERFSWSESIFFFRWDLPWSDRSFPYSLGQDLPPYSFSTTSPRSALLAREYAISLNHFHFLYVTSLT